MYCPFKIQERKLSRNSIDDLILRIYLLKGRKEGWLIDL